MPAHLFIRTLENNHVHFDAEWNNYTLCGLETLCDEAFGIQASIPTTKKVNCPLCISVVELCHKIKKTEYKK